MLVFFGAVINTIGFLSSYADLFESIKLIKAHSKLLIKRHMLNKYRDDFDVDVVEQYRSLPDPDNRFPWRRLRKMFGPEADESLQLSAWGHGAAGQCPRRDAFFWFLLVFNSLLLATVAILVGGAVVKTYFP